MPGLSRQTRVTDGPAAVSWRCDGVVWEVLRHHLSPWRRPLTTLNEYCQSQTHSFSYANRATVVVKLNIIQSVVLTGSARDGQSQSYSSTADFNIIVDNKYVCTSSRPSRLPSYTPVFPLTGLLQIYRIGFNVNCLLCVYHERYK